MPTLGLVFGFIMFARGGIWAKKARAAGSEQQPEKPIGIFRSACRLTRGSYKLDLS